MYVHSWLPVSPETEETDSQMMQSNYNNDLFSNKLLQVSIELDYQFNRFEYPVNNKKHYRVNINFLISSHETVSLGNQRSRHTFVLGQIRQIL